MRSFGLLALCVPFVLSSSDDSNAMAAHKTIYDFSVKASDGSTVSLSKYRGQVVIVVNVASQCGFTKNHYTELKALQDKYYDQGLRVAAFPCNQFGAQTLLRAYKIYVRPIVECGTTVFNPTKKKDIGLLESVQNNFTRKLFMRCYGLHYCDLPNGSTRAKLLGLPSLCSRRKKADLLMLLKILTKTVAVDPLPFLKSPLSGNRKGKLRIYVSVARTQTRSSFLTYRNLRKLNCLLGESENVTQMLLPALKAFIARRFFLLS